MSIDHLDSPLIRPPTKVADIGLKQLGALSNLPLSSRLDLIAEGLPVLFRSAESLYPVSSQVGKGSRAGQILEGQATEEAAKILILLDYVRCPQSLRDRLQKQLRAFYNHGARLIYAQACSWKPTDVAMLRTYVDQMRLSHYVEGNCGEYIVPNWEVYTREARLYADLTCTDGGTLTWNDPESWALEADLFDLLPASLSITRSLSRVGAFTREGLRIIHDVWAETPFKDKECHALSDTLTQVTLQKLFEAGLQTEDASDKDVQMIYSKWQLPMYTIDTVPRDAVLDELRAEQAAQSEGMY